MWRRGGGGSGGGGAEGGEGSREERADGNRGRGARVGRPGTAFAAVATTSTKTRRRPTDETPRDCRPAKAPKVNLFRSIAAKQAENVRVCQTRGYRRRRGQRAPPTRRPRPTTSSLLPPRSSAAPIAQTLPRHCRPRLHDKLLTGLTEVQEVLERCDGVIPRQPPARQRWYRRSDGRKASTTPRPWPGQSPLRPLPGASCGVARTTGRLRGGGEPPAHTGPAVAIAGRAV